jgi:hypothetical protein
MELWQLDVIGGVWLHQIYIKLGIASRVDLDQLDLDDGDGV